MEGKTWGALGEPSDHGLGFDFRTVFDARRSVRFLQLCDSLGDSQEPRNHGGLVAKTGVHRSLWLCVGGRNGERFEMVSLPCTA